MVNNDKVGRFKVAYYNAKGQRVFVDTKTNEIIGTMEDLEANGYC